MKNYIKNYKSGILYINNMNIGTNNFWLVIKNDQINHKIIYIHFTNKCFHIKHANYSLVDYDFRQVTYIQ